MNGIGERVGRAWAAVVVVDTMVGVLLSIVDAPSWMYPVGLVLFGVAALRGAESLLRRELNSE
jgi:hypothetical protein